MRITKKKDNVLFVDFKRSIFKDNYVKENLLLPSIIMLGITLLFLLGSSSIIILFTK